MLAKSYGVKVEFVASSTAFECILFTRLLIAGNGVSSEKLRADRVGRKQTTFVTGIDQSRLAYEATVKNKN